VEQYKGYWVSSFAFMTYGYGNDWHARGLELARKWVDEQAGKLK
jgi:hypothetical protein